MGNERQEQNATKRPRSSTRVGAGNDAKGSDAPPEGALAMQRQAGNRAVAELAGRDPVALRRAVGVQRQPVADKRPSTRAAHAEDRLRQRWGVRTIRAGTIEEQAAELIRYGTVPRTTAPADVERMLRTAGWASWTPSADHGVWDDLVQAFDAVGGVFGGVPKIDRILFFQTAWRHDPGAAGGPALAPQQEEGAYVSGTTMGVNEHGTRDQLSLPTATARSKEGGRGINVGLASRLQVMTHELGHGLVQAFLVQDPVTEARRFEQQVGWHQHSRLYDVQGPGVRQALARGDAPDAAQLITGANWFQPKWKEQPPSRYSVTGGPGEDMAETLMMFVRDKGTLGDRSPARLAWADGVLAALSSRPHALQMPITGVAAELGAHRGDAAR
jgi:hypothetical protein